MKNTNLYLEKKIVVGVGCVLMYVLRKSYK